MTTQAEKLNEIDSDLCSSSNSRMISPEEGLMVFRQVEEAAVNITVGRNASNVRFNTSP